MSVLWEVTATVPQTGTFVGSFWWDGQLQRSLRYPAAAKLSERITLLRTELEAGVRECTPGPPPARPVPFDERNPDHAMFLLMQCHGVPVEGGRIRMAVETVGPRNVEEVRIGQTVH